MPDATEGVEDDTPIETKRDLIEHDFSKDFGMTDEEVVEYEEENGLPKR